MRMKNVAMTTCDDWWLEAREVEYLPNGDFTAKGVIIKAFGVPVFYLPSYSGNTLEEHETFRIKQGFDSRWGYQLLIAKGFRITPRLRTEVEVGIMTNRGFSLGNRTQYKTKKSVSELYLYGLYDTEPRHDLTLGSKQYNGRFDTEEHRGRIQASHRSYLTDETTLRLNADYQTDSDLLWEVFSDDYRTEPQPTSFADLTWLGQRFAISGNVRPRLNYFETTVERLPELRLSAFQQELGFGGLQYRSETTVADLRMHWRSYDLNRPGLTDPADYEATRLDSAHTFYRPLTLGGWLRVVPRAGIRLTHYTDSSDRAITQDDLDNLFAIDDPRAIRGDARNARNYDDNGDARTRMAYELGTELSFKSYRNWADAQSHFWDVDGLRHVVEPYVNYTYIPEPNVSKDHLYFFDGTDRLDEVNVIRIGARQRFETRRADQVYTFARIENYLDFHPNPENGQAKAGDFGTVLHLKPRTWLGFRAKALVDSDTMNLSVFSLASRLGEEDGVNGEISYLFRDAHRARYVDSWGSELTSILDSQAFGQSYSDTHALGLTFTLPINAITRLKTYHYFDLDRGVLGVQSYELQRELRCWVAALRLEENNNSFGIFLMLYLKQFPGFKVGS
jgi:LPS-assembly protein